VNEEGFTLESDHKMLFTTFGPGMPTFITFVRIVIVIRCTPQCVPAVCSRRIGTELKCVHIFPAVLRIRPGLGYKLITVCPGNATMCDGAFPV